MLAALAALATSASAGVVGSRFTQIISPPPGTTNVPADGPSDAAVKVAAGLVPDALSFLFDRSPTTTEGPTLLEKDPFVQMERPADNLEFSQDNRVVKYAAFDSMATNLVPGTTSDGHHHIFLFTRDVNNTTNPLAGTLTQVDPNKGGDSYKPSLDGQTLSGNGATTPHCVVFESTSKLTSDDSSSGMSIYLFDMATKQFTLVSGAKEPARDAVVDGKCQSVTYESGGVVYLYWIQADATFKIDNGYNPDQQTDGKGVAYDSGGQVWYKPFTTGSFCNVRCTRRFASMIIGGKVLVSNSAVNPSKPANGKSGMPSVNDNGDYVAFESTATDLCADPNTGAHQRCQGVGIDRNGSKSDVFRRTLTSDAPSGSSETTPQYVLYPVKKRRKNGSTYIAYKKKRIRFGNEMEMISYSGKDDFQSKVGDSDQVKISGAGEQACFRSFGSDTHDLKFQPDGHTGPFMHIYFWNAPRERVDANKLPISQFTGESKELKTSDTEFTHADGTSAWNWSCAISNRGNVIGWTSDVENKSGEANGRLIPDMFLRFMGASDENLGGIGA